MGILSRTGSRQRIFGSGERSSSAIGRGQDGRGRLTLSGRLPLLAVSGLPETSCSLGNQASSPVASPLRGGIPFCRSKGGGAGSDITLTQSALRRKDWISVVLVEEYLPRNGRSRRCPWWTPGTAVRKRDTEVRFQGGVSRHTSIS